MGCLHQPTIFWYILVRWWNTPALSGQIMTIDDLCEPSQGHILLNLIWDGGPDAFILVLCSNEMVIAHFLPKMYRVDVLEVQWCGYQVCGSWKAKTLPLKFLFVSNLAKGSSRSLFANTDNNFCITIVKLILTLRFAHFSLHESLKVEYVDLMSKSCVLSRNKP